MMTFNLFEGNLEFSQENFFDYSALDADKLSSSLSNTVDPKKASEYLVAFSTQTSSYCVGIVDMVDSTKICAEIGPAKISRYYQIFLNSMSKILSRFGGFVIKNVGDCLVYYFPESNKPQRKFGFLSCLECSLTMSDSRNFICQKLNSEGLPNIDFRISADYGPVVIMNQTNSDSLDLIGPPVNMCSKINRLAGRNEFVLGGDLYHMVKEFSDYRFKQVKDYSLGFKLSYPVYSVCRKSLN